MKFMEFKHKDIWVKVHSSLVVTREVYEQQRKIREELIYANVIDIDSRVQAVFAQFHSARKVSDVTFGFSHAPSIGELDYDKSTFYLRPEGKYKHLSSRENETLVSGVVVNEKVLQRQHDGYIIFAWDGNFEEKLFWAIDRHYETPFLPEWTGYLMRRLLEESQLNVLKVHDFDGLYPELVVYELLVDDEVLDEHVSLGLRNGEIQIEEDIQEAL
ncbi:hypothetical protein QP794_23925 [Paenibacillus sp. UMB7766-LJ446]|uniref:hypothetical protein n=1 Tax=Paenibacillus TaxID=44249 RepID=UPI00254F7BD7|nr:hypothetical protein [Paenibacillus sp. UMB7766-LJ446]MDK8193141.1 hypothetical protein [Paenibacillus sp. UMB7766-LJ446]